MTAQIGSLGRDYTRRDQIYADPYASGTDSFHQRQRRLFEHFANQQRQAQRGMSGGYPPPFGGGMGGFQFPQTHRGGMGPMTGVFRPYGISPGFMGGMGMGMGIGNSGRPSFLRNSTRGAPRHPHLDFGAGGFSRTHNPYSHQDHGYSTWPRTHHSSFVSRFLNEDDSDDSDEYNGSSVYRFPPRRRRAGLGRHHRPIYGRRTRSRYHDDFEDDYDGFGDFYEEDDDDYGDFYPATRRYPRY